MPNQPLLALRGLAGMMYGNLALAEGVAARMARDGQQAQDKASAQMVETLSAPPENFLAVVYAGLSAFEGPLEHAKKMREASPSAHIVVLTCDCDFEFKWIKLGPLCEQGVINEVVVTPWCGGVTAMSNMLTALINTWPKCSER